MSLEKYPLAWNLLPGTPAFTVRYLEGDPEVHQLFVGAPWQEAVVKQRLEEVTARNTPHREVASALLSLYPEEQYPRIVREIEHLRKGAPVVITAHQPGLFGGPSYTLYKFLSTRALANYWSHVLRCHIVPAFWIASEDSDLSEMGRTALPHRSGGVWQARISIRKSDRNTPAFIYRLDPADLARLSEQLEALLPNATVRKHLRDAYAEGSLFDTFFRLYALWAESLGVVLIPAHFPELRRLALPIYQRELETAGLTTQLVNEIGKRLRAFHLKPPIHKAPTRLNFYWIRDQRRVPLSFSNGRLIIGNQDWSLADFRSTMEAHPDRIASGVVLRPIVQDFLFRTLTVVAGPSEMVYLPQLRSAYDHFGVPFPLVAPRFSATVLSGRFARLTSRFGLSPGDLFTSEGGIWQKAASENHLAKTLQKWEQTETRIRNLLAEIRKAAQEVNPSLASEIGEWAKTFLHQNYSFRESLRKSLREKEPDLQSEVKSLCNFIRPLGKPQERVFPGVYFYAILGEELFHAPIELTPDDFRHHWLLKPEK